MTRRGFWATLAAALGIAKTAPTLTAPAVDDSLLTLVPMMYTVWLGSGKIWQYDGDQWTEISESLTFQTASDTVTITGNEYSWYTT